MRLLVLLLSVVLAATPVAAQQAGAPTARTVRGGVETPASSAPDTTASNAQDTLNLPVSLDKIKEALQQPAPTLSLRSLDERPTFRVQIRERMRIEELLASLNFKTAPAPGGGLYGYEQQRQMWDPVSNPMRQPYAAFSQGELLTILIENLVGKYLAGKAANAISEYERKRAEAAAKDDVRAAVNEYCAAQPNRGAGLQICETTIR